MRLSWSATLASSASRLREFGFELLLRAQRGRGIAHDALDLDDADLALGERLAGGQGQAERGGGETGICGA